jgi:hypothetical protein
MTSQNNDQQMENSIHLLQDPSGDAPNLTTRSTALEHLVTLGDYAHKRLVDRLLIQHQS